MRPWMTGTTLAEPHSEQAGFFFLTNFFGVMRLFDAAEKLRVFGAAPARLPQAIGPLRPRVRD